MWDLPGPGLKPVSPALAGGFLTTAPPGKSLQFLIIMNNAVMIICVKVFVEMFSFLLGEMSGRMVILCLKFKDNAEVSSKVAVSFYIPTSDA